MAKKLSAEEQAKQLGQVQAQRMITLLEQIDLTDEERQAFVTIVPKLTFEQIDELIAMLEVKYINQQTQDVDDKLNQDIMQIKQTYDAARQDIADHTMAELDALEKEIDELATQ